MVGDDHDVYEKGEGIQKRGNMGWGGKLICRGMWNWGYDHRMYGGL